MIILKKVVDSQTGLPIPYASIELIDQNGIFLGAGTSADVDGNFALDSLMIKPGSFLKITSSGYQGAAFTYEQFTIDKDAAFALSRDNVELPEVIITAAKKAVEKNKNLVYAGLGILAIYLLTKKK
jgi:hypothetical protein